MGRVFLGQSRSGRPVAVKLIRPELAEDPQFRDRFAREVDAARRVSAFHTAAVVDADPAADPPWLVTDYVAGPSLQEAVAHRPLSPMTVRVLGSDLAEGLAAIHASGLVHRDLKPSNVILANDAARVIDFGIARALDATSQTASRVVIGTPSYMSPEQARGHMVSPPSDVFSLGTVLAFAATGRSPFGTGPAEAVIYRVVHDDPELTGLPPALADLVIACLAKNPDERPGVPDILDQLAVPAAPRATLWPPPEITTMITERTAIAAEQLPSGPYATTDSAASASQRPSSRPQPSREAAATAAPVTFRASKRTRMLTGAVALAVVFVLPMAGVLVIAVWASWIELEDVVSPLGVMAFLVAFGMLVGLVMPHDVITMDADGLCVHRKRLWPTRQRSFLWDDMRQITMVGGGSVVVWFRPGRGPSKLPQKRQFKGGLVVAKAAETTGLIGQRKRIREIHNTLAQFASDIYVETV
jgi:Protein kinase domain